MGDLAGLFSEPFKTLPEVVAMTGLVKVTAGTCNARLGKTLV